MGDKVGDKVGDEGTRVTKVWVGTAVHVCVGTGSGAF